MPSALDGMTPAGRLRNLRSCQHGEGNPQGSGLIHHRSSQAHQRENSKGPGTADMVTLQAPPAGFEVIKSSTCVFNRPGGFVPPARIPGHFIRAEVSASNPSELQGHTPLPAQESSRPAFSTERKRGVPTLQGRSASDRLRITVSWEKFWQFRVSPRKALHEKGED